MLRGWTLAVVCLELACFSPRASAQISLAERLGLVSGSSDDVDDAMYDPDVRPAAAAAPAGPRAPRDAGQSQQKRRSSGGGSLFSNFHLPGFGSSSAQHDAQLDDAPLPYDPSELKGAAGRASTPPAATRSAAGRTPAGGTTMQQLPAGAAGRGRTSPPPGRTTAGGGTTTGGGVTSAAPTAERPTLGPRTATAPARTATGLAPGAMAGSSASTAPRVARSSPRLDNRHNELADALTGLRGAAGDESADADSPRIEPTMRDSGGDIAPPAADGGEAVPSYIDGAAGDDAADAGDEDTSPRGWSRGPLDVRDALMGDSTGRDAAPRPATAPAPERRPVVAPPARRPATRPASPAPSPSDPVAEDETLLDPAAGAGPETETLGTIEAEPAPIEYQSNPIRNRTGAAPRAVSPPAPAVPPMGASIAPPTLPVAAGPKPRPTTPQGPPRTVSGYRAPRGDVLASCRPPQVVSTVSGPPRIIVGRTAEYRITLENKGEQSARDLVAMVRVPGSAEIADLEASNGAVDRSPAPAVGEPQAIKWQLYELAAGGTQTLVLQLTPQSGQPLSLSVACTQAAASAETTVDVQEPKLQMEITGPNEVMFGKAQRFSLTLSNPGTGEAEDVLIELVPPGGDPKTPVRHKVGALAAGSSKTIELELTAREPGELKMLAAAQAAGQLHTETTKTVLCRKAQLDVDWRGPDKNFAGAVATYYIRVRNPGTAPADRVAVELTLPAGAELVAASAGHKWDAQRRMLVWTPGALAASEERFMQVQCKLSTPGTNHMELVARTAAGDLSDVQSVPVNVEALADLKLQVTDPEGVLPVGQTATYEIHVQNRGQTAARGVNVVAMFSEGIEPEHVEGGQHEIRDGRVAFRTIDALPAGAEVVLRIHAKASQPGTHVFRAEVVCDDLDTKLSSEETTRFFVEEQRWADASAAYSDDNAATKR
jgi:uncharacterized repeat protein (TIGR01451 family)